MACPHRCFFVHTGNAVEALLIMILTRAGREMPFRGSCDIFLFMFCTPFRFFVVFLLWITFIIKNK